MPVQIHTELPGRDARADVARAIERVLGQDEGNWFVSVIEPPHSPEWHFRVEGPNVNMAEVFFGPEEKDGAFIAARLRQMLRIDPVVIRHLAIAGFGPFSNTTIPLDALTVLVGANGTGKTSAFEFLRAIREFVRTEIPPEIIPGWETREVFHRPGPDRLAWRMSLDIAEQEFTFGADIMGPRGNPTVTEEIADVRGTADRDLARLHRSAGRTTIFDGSASRQFLNTPPNQLAFRSFVTPADRMLYRLHEQIDTWRFFSGIHFDDLGLRQPAFIDHNPTLRDNGSNLASVLNWLQSAHSETFREIELHVRGVVPAFRRLAVRPTGAGRVTITWEEEGSVAPLTAAELSDGSLRLLLWITLALAPNPPGLVCIDEPESGMHPRTLPKIAALLKKLSERTQVLIATHSSYLLTQFAVADIAVLQKRNGTIECTRPGTSAALVANLSEFGAEELELMHRSDELEAFT